MCAQKKLNNKALDANITPSKRAAGKGAAQLQDNRSKSLAKRQQGFTPANTINNQWLVQKKHNDTGLPDQLKSGIENLSGLSMDDVRVHYSSDKPAQLNAHAYAQGTDIHIAKGQEKHLPHEAWHVVQQKQGRVKPTLQMKGVNINDNRGLEKEADIMGAKALQQAGTKTNEIGNAAATKPTHTIQKTTQAVAQLIPDKAELYWQRIEAKAGYRGVTGRRAHLYNFIRNVANIPVVGAAVNAAVVAAPMPASIDALKLTVINAVNLAIAPRTAAPGQYAADTAFNADLTRVLRLNPFLISVMTGALHKRVPKWRGARPAAVPAPQGAVPGLGGNPGIVPALHSMPLPAAGADDRVLETTDLFNRLTNLPNQLPPVVVNSIIGPHAAMGTTNINQPAINARMDLGWAAARGNILHEFGHHLENNLSPADFATLHNFLTARVHIPAPVVGVPPAPFVGPMAGMRPEAGYFFEHHPGYNIDMPQINAGGVAARPVPQGWWQRVKHRAAAVKQSVTRAYHATWLRYVGLGVSGIKQQIGKLVSVMSMRREPRTWGGEGVENFFVYNANNQHMSYSTAVHRFNTITGENEGTTEYLSTTVEFFNRPSHTRELVSVDPLRVALFLYMANRPQYLLVRAAFAGLPALPVPPGGGAAPVRPDLNDLIHTIN